MNAKKWLGEGGGGGGWDYFRMQSLIIRFRCAAPGQCYPAAVRVNYNCLCRVHKAPGKALIQCDLIGSWIGGGRFNFCLPRKIASIVIFTV